MRQLALAVISDLHFGRHARSKDLCPHADGPSLDEKFQDAFIEFIRAQNIKCDFLILPGDVAEIADPLEVELVSRFVKRAARALGVLQKNIVFVPGNHDVDWAVLAAGHNPVRWGQRYDPIRFRDYIFRKLVGEKGKSVLDDPYLALWKMGDIQVVGFNSSWNDNEKALLHYGEISLSQLTALETLLATVDKSPDVLRVFLVHHHPISYDNPVPGEPDFSQMVNNEQLLQLLRQNYFDLLIHGHTHQPRFQIHQRDGSVPMGILAAGSFSLRLPIQWSGKVGNQFHVINIDGRNATTKFIEGSVQSWTYYFGHGWTRSSLDREGIAHQEPFGTHLDPHQCRDRLQALISARLATGDYTTWAALSTDDPSLIYLRPERISLALSRTWPSPRLRSFSEA